MIDVKTNKLNIYELQNDFAVDFLNEMKDHLEKQQLETTQQNKIDDENEAEWVDFKW